MIPDIVLSIILLISLTQYCLIGRTAVAFIYIYFLDSLFTKKNDNYAICDKSSLLFIDIFIWPALDNQRFSTSGGLVSL